MKLRLTPLNIATAFLVVLAFISWQFDAVLVKGSKFLHWSGTIAIVYLVFALALFWLDLIFRNFFPQTRRLWVIETSFIALTVILYLLAVNK